MIGLNPTQIESLAWMSTKVKFLEEVVVADEFTTNEIDERAINNEEIQEYLHEYLFDMFGDDGLMYHVYWFETKLESFIYQNLMLEYGHICFAGYDMNPPQEGQEYFVVLASYGHQQAMEFIGVKDFQDFADM